MTVSEKDLAGLVFYGLVSHYKEKLEGFDFLSINHLQLYAMSLEYRLKNAKESCETNQSIHVDCKSDSDDEKNEVAEFIWSSKAKPYFCSSLKPIPKNQ